MPPEMSSEEAVVPSVEDLEEEDFGLEDFEPGVQSLTEEEAFEVPEEELEEEVEAPWRFFSAFCFHSGCFSASSAEDSQPRSLEMAMMEFIRGVVFST